MARKRKNIQAYNPLKSYRHFSEYYRTEIDKSEIVSIVKNYVKVTYDKEDVKIMLKAPDWAFYKPHIASYIKWEELDNTVPDNLKFPNGFKKILDDIKNIAIRKKKDKSPVFERTSPAEIVKKRTGEFIASIDNKLDANETFDIYEELQKVSAPAVFASKCLNYYKPQYEEVKELIDDKPDDLVEAYSHLSKSEQKSLLKLFENIIEGCEKYSSFKSATRKPRKPKTMKIGRQVKSINYLKESLEYKIASINPIKIIGGHRLYVFCENNKTIIEYVSRSPKGFEIKGTTLQFVDEEISRQTRLRKPHEFLSMIQSTSSSNKISKEWNALTTKSTKPNNRINKHSVLLKVLQK